MTARRQPKRGQSTAADEGDDEPESVDIQQVPLRSIDVSGDNPRVELVVEELMASIRVHGLLQPVVVRRVGRRFELIAGHRRLEALRQLGWKTVPTVVRGADEDDAPVLRLVENLQRRDLRPAEEASALEALIRTRGWTTHQVAAAIGRSQAYVSKRVRVFEDPLLAPAVLADQLSISAAEELLTLDERTRYRLLSRAVEHHWDRQQVREAASRRFAANPSERPPGFTRRVREFRMELRDIAPPVLTAADRRELRLLFDELAMLARAPNGKREPVFPPLPARGRAAARQRRE
jgi:ParB family chromosome partitioning protein